MFKPIYNLFQHHYHTRYHGVYRHAKKLFVFDLLLLALALALFASSIFLFFWNPGLTDQIDLKISLGNNRIKSGEEIKITVDYKNRSKHNLRDSILAIHFPSGFVVDRTFTPTSTFGIDSTFDLKNLLPGASGQTEVYGHLWVEPKMDEKITALLSYLPENSNSREQKFGSFLLNLSDSVLKSSLEISTTSFANAHVPFVYKIVNTSDTQLKNLNFELDFPGKINGTKDTDIQNITLEKNGEKLITGEIVIPNKSGKYDLTVIAIASINNQPIKVLNNRTTISTFSPNVFLKAELKDAPAYTQPKQIINATINWKNNGQYELHKATIRLSFTTGVVDIQTTAQENGFKIDGNNLLITESQRTALTKAQPQDTDQFDFKIYLLPTFNLGNIENANLEIKSSFEAEVKGADGQKFYTNSDAVIIPLTTELNLSSEARYYSNEGDQLGRGPLPPQVGETTKYWIFIQVKNTTNPVRDASFTAVLPAGVNFTGKQSVSIGPSLNFNADNHSVNWNYRELPPNSQTGLYFEVAVSPTSDQINKNIDLLKNLKFTATDKITGKQFDLNKSVINNILPASDKGSKK